MVLIRPGRVNLRIPETSEEEKMVRLNVSLKEAWIEKIDEYKESDGLFSGRTDFIFAAVRFYYFELIESAKEAMYELRESRTTDNDILETIESVVVDDIDERLRRYNESYKNDNKLQVSIYFSLNLRRYIKEMETIGGKRPGQIIQAAIVAYDEHLFHMLRSRDIFNRSMNGLHSRIDDN